MNKTTVQTKHGPREIVVPTADEPLEVVIDRTKWHRGKGADGSKLLIVEHANTPSRCTPGDMCCLGFDALALGFTVEDIEHVPCPGNLGRSIPGLTHDKAVSMMETVVCNKMMNINDDCEIAPADRERQLTDLAHSIHRKFVFIN